MPVDRKRCDKSESGLLTSTTSVWATTTPQVTLEHPALAKVSEAAEAISDEMLVDVALEMFGGDGGAGGDVASSKAPTTVPKAVKTIVAGVVKGPANHLVSEDILRGTGSGEDKRGIRCWSRTYIFMYVHVVRILARTAVFREIGMNMRWLMLCTINELTGGGRRSCVRV